jgi:hypothetical protein
MDSYSPAYGYLQISEDGRELTVTGTRETMSRWAQTPGMMWPCSELSRCASVVAKLDARGDLVDLYVRPHSRGEDLPGDELTAWLDASILQGWREVVTRRPMPLPIVETALRRERAARGDA